MAEAAAELGVLAGEFYSVWFRCRPDAALAAGVAGYEGLLPVQDDDELSALVRWLETLVLALEDIDIGSLDPQDRLDWVLMHTSARFEHDMLSLGDWRWRDPSAFLPIGQIYRLTMASPQTMRERLGSLLASVPEYLRHAQRRLREAAPNLTPLLVRGAAREADGGRCYIRELVNGSWLRRHWQDISELETITAAACDALADYRACMVSEVLPRARAEPGCGVDRLATRLAGNHFLDCDPLALHPVLDAAEAANASDLDALARDAGESAQDLLAGAASQTLAGDARVAAHAELCDAVAGELTDAALVELPEAALRLGVRPACPRPQGFRADYLPDGPSSGTLFLAKPASGALAEPLEAVRARCLDNGWGGSHLINFGAPELARRLPRLAADGTSLANGWRLYLGYRLACARDCSPQRLAWTLVQRRRQIGLARMDLAVHGEGLDEARACAGLRAAGFPDAPEPVLARLLSRPGEALAGVLGWLLIEEARRLWQREHGEGFDQRDLHREILAQGEIPVSLALSFGLGERLWDEARRRVLRV